MACLSRAVYALFLLSFALSPILARPLTLAADSQVEKSTTNTGQGTWFNPGLGACGYVDSSSDPIIAIASSRFGTGGNCNQVSQLIRTSSLKFNDADQWIKITNADNGKSAYGRTRDSCPSCDSGDLDMSPAVFKQIGNLDTGVIPITWSFQPKGWSP